MSRTGMPRVVVVVAWAWLAFAGTSCANFADNFTSVSTFETISSAFDLATTLSKVDVLSEDIFPRCRDDLEKYLSAISSLHPWALLMFDSTAKIPSGILQGNIVQFGHFDECLSVREGSFKGKHCTGEVNITSIPILLYAGVCVPSSCTARDIQNAFRSASKDIGFTVDESNCWTDDPVPLDSEDWIVICFLVGVVVVVLASTVFDLLHERNIVSSHRHELYSSFSLRRNVKQLVRVSNHSENLKCLNGLRSLTMMWVVLGHQYLVTIRSPAANLAKALTYLADEAKIPLRNATVSVDSFFLLSGFLVSLVFFRDIGKKKCYDVPVAMIHRFIRLTPAFAAMVLIQSTILIRFGRGPLWNPIMSQARQACRDNWWPGLLYVQNFVSPSSVCLGQSWYLSSDMQMFWLSPLLLFPIFLWQKLAPLIFAAALAASVATNYIVGYLEDLGPHMTLTRNYRQFEVDYTQTHMRFTPYVLGIGLGFVVCGIKAKKIRINPSRGCVIFGWLTSAALCLGSLYGLAPFYDDDDYSTLEGVSYLALHRLGWSLGIAWVVFACINGFGGPVDSILSWNGFELLGKLSYSIFLIHLTFQLYIIGVMQVNPFIRDFEIVLTFFAVLASSVILSVPLTLLFEMPFANIDRYFLRDLIIFPYPRPKAKSRDESEGEISSKC